MRVYVNAAPIDVSDGRTALDAVRRYNAAAADEVERGALLITDSRGLPTASATPLHGGSILRLVRARHRDAGSATDGD